MEDGPLGADAFYSHMQSHFDIDQNKGIDVDLDLYEEPKDEASLVGNAMMMAKMDFPDARHRI